MRFLLFSVIDAFTYRLNASDISDYLVLLSAISRPLALLLLLLHCYTFMLKHSPVTKVELTVTRTVTYFSNYATQTSVLSY
jgi:hypothetical protein